ncbi:hypothetical protein ACRARH_26040 [Phytobacter ursingii]
MNKSRIFITAWTIARKAVSEFGGNAKSYFAEALKMSYRLAKKISLNTLTALGGREWIKNDLHRIYFNFEALCKLVGFEYTTYKTGNISSAQLNGVQISNSAASDIRANLAVAKFWFDVNESIFSSQYMKESLFDLAVRSFK